MALYVPTVQTAYVLEGMFSEAKWAALLASGALDLDTLSNLIREGDFVNVPKLEQSADFERTNIASSSDLSPTAAATNDDKGVILRDHALNSWKRHDDIRANEQIGNKKAMSAGNKLAKRMLAQVGNVLSGAVDALTTSHTVDVTAESTKTISVNAIRAAKATLDDEGYELNVGLIHSRVWWDLIKDLQGYNYLETVGAQVVRSARLGEIMGISTWIITDNMPQTAGGFSTDDDDTYRTFLLGPGSVFFGYQAEPSITTDFNLLKPSTLFYQKIDMDYLIHPRTFAFGGSANPADADLATSGNWTPVTEDHKNCRIAQIKSHGQSGKL